MYTPPPLKDTLEVRWFFQELPFPIALLFDDEVPPNIRTDWYALPCDARCGIKIREGRLETKLLTASLGHTAIGPTVGLVESWRKWSVDYDNILPPTETQLEQTGWVAVQKRRYLLSYEIRDGHPVEVNDPSDNGCDVELTQLRLLHDNWWTVGFEATGPQTQLQEYLKIVAAHALPLVLAPSDIESMFVSANSYSYPYWLNELNGGKPCPSLD